MALLTQDNAMAQGVPTTLTRAALANGDTIPFVNGSRQTLVLYNTTAGALTVTLTGSAATTLDVKGYGSVSVAAGKAITVGASSTVLVELDDIAAFLIGTVTVTVSGAGVTAHLFV